MNKMHVAVSVIIGLIVGGVLGSLGYSKTAARYDAITTACVMVNQAVEHDILKPEQVKQLGELTGQSLKKDYSSVTSKFKFADNQLDNASEASNCSQFIVGVNAAQ
ncbi:hypothetical protein F895_02794 [Acinetobacter sp. CIP 64.2]|uniref:hypothetical protein n=1 Tax=Acinetobacter sp. CIP 64.2 TaxID=1217694 RepID=UPI000288B134|nr:hypothetical protein [Acinetobacter sp. CIP 64.2]ENX13066.1 hypothetical protein F895_02794 [Acinetobacter sp. CIP 64.2]